MSSSETISLSVVMLWDNAGSCMSDSSNIFSRKCKKMREFLELIDYQRIFVY
jgi:hypothetical protein